MNCGDLNEAYKRLCFITAFGLWAQLSITALADSKHNRDIDSKVS